MFFRGRQPETAIWRRFRSGIDGFSVERDGELYVARVVANGDRVVDLFHALSEHLPPAIDISIGDVRTGHAWRGEQIPLDDARDAVARLKLPISAYGGVELSLFTSDDQLTIDQHLELWTFARTEQWLYLLLGKGLELRDEVRARSWRLSRRELAPAPELTASLTLAAERLTLVSDAGGASAMARGPNGSGGGGGMGGAAGVT